MAIIVIIVAIVAAASKAILDISGQRHTVVYTVTGNGTADIQYDTYTNGNAGSAESTGQSLPWSMTVTGSGLFTFYSVTATISTGSSATCTITLDGRVISTNTATGQLASATCSGAS